MDGDCGSNKGACGKFGVDKCLEFIEENGDGEGDILVKTDQEPAIQYLIKELVEARADGKTVVEESPVKSSGSNGVAERGVQEIEGEIRALFIGLQERLGRKLDARERIVAFILEYAAYLANRLVRGSDGKVVYERIKGKEPTVLGVEFGEKVLYKVKLGSKLEKINPRWEYGIFVGVRRRSNEIQVATKEGIVSVRSVRRIPVEKRWCEDCVDWIRWAPWHRYKDARDADGDVPEGVPAEERIKSEAAGSGSTVVVVRSPIPRDFQIAKKDAEKFGYTRGCAGCSSWFRGLARQPHTGACRERFRGLMKDEAKVLLQTEKRKEFERAELERQARRFLKKEEKKRKAEEDAVDERLGVEDMEEQSQAMDTNDVEVLDLVGKWIAEVQAEMLEDEEGDLATAWDDVHGGDLPIEAVRDARAEEVGYMEQRQIWSVVPITECWKRTDKGPVSVRWVDTNKGGVTDMIVRSRLVARDFKGDDKGRDDLFAETPPLEAKRMSWSRTVTRRKDGAQRRLVFIDARKAHLNPRCEEDVYIELPEECGCPKGMCGKLNFWLYGFRPAAAAWEKLYSGRFEEVGFIRGESCGVVFYHPERDLSVVVHGDDFTFCAVKSDLMWIKELMESWFEIKVRAVLGPDATDDKEVVILGRIVRWTDRGL